MNGIKYGFTLCEKSGVSFLTIPSFVAVGGVVCAFSTRIGGVSPTPYDTLNFSRKREKNEEHFQENMRRFSVAAGFECENAVSTNYAHGAQLYRAEQKDVGRGIMRENVSIFCDGLFTDEQRVPIISFHADCVPLFFYDPVRRAVAICHAGWRGTSQHITRNAVKSLQLIGCQPENILAAVGPCIGVQNYEVGPEVVDVFRHEFGETTVQQRDDHWYADLTVACALDMLRSGIIPAHITISGLCTYEDATLFYSHRRDSGRTGAMASVIELI